MDRHNLHVKIDIKLRQRLAKLKRKLGVRSISRLVKELIEKSRPVLEQRYFEDEEKASQYKLVSDDPTLDRVSLHIYLKEEDYRWLKQNHQDLNFFSIAQIVRCIIGWGIALLELGADEAQRQWRKIVQDWEKRQQGVRRKMEKVRQLFSCFQSQSQEFFWVSIYNREFSPLRKILLKC